MKKRLFVFVLAFVIIVPKALAVADNTPAMLITKTDSTQVAIEIATLRSIKFSDGMMVVTAQTGTQQTVNLDDIAVITFGSMTTAVETLVPQGSTEHLMITDLAGRVVYEGTAQGFAQHDGLRGVYVVKVGTRSYKVAVK